MATCFSESLVNGPKLEREPTKQTKSAHKHDPEMVEQAAVTTNHEFMLLKKKKLITSSRHT